MPSSYGSGCCSFEKGGDGIGYTDLTILSRRRPGGSITDSAESLHVTPPNLSRQIKASEEELDTKLFIRGNRKITLTKEGVLLLQIGALYVITVKLKMKPVRMEKAFNLKLLL